MRAAFKEWAAVVAALGCGDQMLILRKGGISEDRGVFKPVHSRFLFFPTLFHQQRESIIPAAQARFDEWMARPSAAGHFHLDFFAEVIDAIQLVSLSQAEGLRGQHIWREEIVADRFDWGRDKSIFALAVRVHRLPATLALPLLPEYAGCKSWLEFDREIETAGSVPVLSDAQFAHRLERFRAALAPEMAPLAVPLRSGEGA